MRDDGQKNEEGERVDPPENSRRRAGIGDRKGRKIGHHQEKDQQRDHAGFIGDLRAEPSRAHQKSTNEKAEDPSGTGDGKGCCYIEIESPDQTLWVEESEAEANRKVIQRDQGEGAESPEDKGVGQSGQRALSDDFSLAEHFPEEVPHPLADGRKAEIRVLFGSEDAFENRSESPPKQHSGGDDQCDQN